MCTYFAAVCSWLSFSPVRYSDMRVIIVGRGPLAEPLARLAERGEHTVTWVEQAPSPWSAVAAPDLVILAGSSTAVHTLLEQIASSIADDVIVVDATIPTVDEGVGDDAERQQPGTEWIPGLLRGARIVRAFASVPAEALESVLHRTTSADSDRLAVPLAGDDHDAKGVAATFMRTIGVEPFDLGALRGADVLAPGGALWGKALNQIEMLEAVGELSGDG
jgi:8-hydroxy-5-deazaflavin:NADPH oxidoreductase